MFKNNKLQKSLLLALTAVLLAGTAGCSRFAAPQSKLEYSLYSPESSIAARGQYIIGVRDELEVVVWRCPELDSIVTVRPEDGSITLPLVGDVKADGLTPKELAESISNKIALYVKEPRIAVGVKKFGEKKVFILGEVPAQGTYRLEKEDRIIDLITRAGGFTDDATPSCTYIIRGGYDDPQMVRINLARLIHQGDISQNVYLMEGDIVYVPESEITNYNAALGKVFPSLYFAERLVTLKRDIVDGGYDWKDVFRKRGFWE